MDRSAIGFIQDISEEKCDAKAKICLAFAKDFQKIGTYIFSFYFYNRAINTAVTGDLQATAFAYRATLYLKLLHFEECFESLELAREKCTSMLLLKDIKALEKLCDKHKSKINNYAPEDLMGYFKLSYPANKKIPWIVDCVEMRWTREFGRGIYASKDLKGGDIISVEDMTVVEQNNDSYYMRCFNCNKANYLNLIPCDKTASLMFCSNKCKKELYAKAVDLKNIKRTDMRLLAEFPDPAMIENFVKKPGLNKDKKTIFDYDFSNKNDPQYKENLRTCLLSLSVIHGSDEGSYQSRKYLSQKAVHHLMSIYNSNRKPGIINYYFANPLYVPLNVLALQFAYISLFASLINHSDEENAEIIAVDNKVVTIITKPVKKGDQIFLNYRLHLEPKKYLGCQLIPNNPDDILHYIFLRFRQFKAYKDFLTEKYWAASSNNQRMKNQLYSIYYYSITMFASFCIFPIDRIIPKIL